MAALETLRRALRSAGGTTNVVKHSQARRASVVARMRGDSIVLDVRDDGIGFERGRQNGNSSLRHYGLLGMQQRVEMAGGSWAINPNTPRGSWVPAVVPHGLSDDLHDARDAATLER